MTAMRRMRRSSEIYYLFYVKREVRDSLGRQADPVCPSPKGRLETR
jgi:hypothetical protein